MTIQDCDPVSQEGEGFVVSPRPELGPKAQPNGKGEGLEKRGFQRVNMLLLRVIEAVPKTIISF